MRTPRKCGATRGLGLHAVLGLCGIGAITFSFALAAAVASLESDPFGALKATTVVAPRSASHLSCAGETILNFVGSAIAQSLSAGAAAGDLSAETAVPAMLAAIDQAHQGEAVLPARECGSPHLRAPRTALGSASRIGHEWAKPE